MARTVTPKVRKAVTYYNAAGKPKPAIITSIVLGTTVNLRIGRVATVSSVVLGSRSPHSVRTNCWMPK